MKQLLRKKSFRILLRTVVAVATLLVLAVSLFNWQAAKRKERAIAQARAAGMSLSAADLMAGMPPDHLNFARHGIFALLEDGLAVPEDKQSREQRDAIGRYKALGEESLRRALNRHRPNRSGAIDFAFLPDDGSYGKTAGSFLEKYDSRHGAILGEIRAAMARPHVRRAAVPEGFDGGADWLYLNEAFGFITLGVQSGLRLRSEAALATGDSAKAAESVEMIARLGELTGSRRTMASVMIEFAAYQLVHDRVKRGMELRTWTIADLDRISAAVARLDVRERLIAGASSEATMVQVFDAWKRDRSRIAPYLAAEFFGDRTDEPPPILPRMAASLLLGGVFDRAAAVNLESLHAVLGILRDPAPADCWAKSADELRKLQFGEGYLTGIFSGATGAATILDLGGRALIRRQLVLAACAIERHRLENGSYPESLTGIPAEFTTDPFRGGTLSYERRGESFRLYTPGPPPDGKSHKSARTREWEW